MPGRGPAGPSEFPVDTNTAKCSGNDMKCSEESYQQQIYEADPTNSPTINQSSPHRRTGHEPDGRRGGLPATCDGQAARTHAATSRKKGIIRIARCLICDQMPDGGIMSASKFTSRI